VELTNPIADVGEYCSCGHMQPDSASNSYKSFHNDFKINQKKTLNLKADYTVVEDGTN
jgi:hypothetical protein